MAFDLGDLVPLTVEIKDADGALAAPGDITLTITLPDGTPVTPTPSSPSLGRYQYDYPTVQEGRHTARWVATGANASAYVDAFDVRPAAPRYIVSLADTKAHLNIDPGVLAHDEELRTYIEAATNVVQDHTGLTLVRASRTDRVRPSSGSELWLPRRPVISVTSLTSLDLSVTWPVTSTDVYLKSEWGQLTRLAGTPWYGDMLASYVPGVAVIEERYTLAAKIIIQHLWSTQRQPSVGPSAFGGGPAPAGPGFAIPNRALELLGKPAPVVA